MTDASTHPYSTLTPDVVVGAVEALGDLCDGRVLALNSYENRVYQVGREDDVPVVVKFYRPGRWTTPQILEEHEFAAELARAEIPVVAPEVHDGRTLFEAAGFRYAVYRRQGGHWPELGSKDERVWMGRFLARIHAIGRTRPFRHRLRLDWRVMGGETMDYLLEAGWIPPHIEAAYASVADDALAIVEQRFSEATPYRTLRLHGDCHPGNVLWTDAGPHFVDLDDCLMGPAVQRTSSMVMLNRQIVNWTRSSRAIHQPLPPAQPHEVRSSRTRSNMTQGRFEDMVRDAREHIAAGDIFQVVLSQRFTRVTNVEPFDVYRAVRRLNPSPYMFFFDFGLVDDEPLYIVGSSPEMFVRLEGRTASLRPIAGTRPRGADASADAVLAEELLADPKERVAEHVMLVDLGRNDLGRVCEYGTVRVSDFFTVEKYRDREARVLRRARASLGVGLRLA